MNTIIDKFFNGPHFSGFLSTTQSGVVIFGYDADWSDEHGWSRDGETHSGYMVYKFASVEEARDTLKDWGYV